MCVSGLAAIPIAWSSNKAMPAMPTPTAITVAESAFPALPGIDFPATLANALLRLGERLNGPRLVVAVATIGEATADLTAGERLRYDEIPSPERRQSWLAGRAAIKAARTRLGLDTDTAALHFPAPCTSLTHAAGFAVAVAAPQGALRGLGVDLEAPRKTSPGASRFYLTESERDWLERCPVERQPEERIRLWTIKEAAFKACPDNRGMNLTRIALQDPASAQGEAIGLSDTTDRAAAENRISYASTWTPAGCVSLALLPIGPRHEPDATEFIKGKKQ